MNSTSKFSPRSILFNFSFCFLAVILSCTFSACGDDDTPQPVVEVEKAYSATIMMPSAADKNVGDEMQVHVNFDEANGGNIENVRVILQQASAAEGEAIVYDKPSDNAVNEASGHHEHHDDFVLSLAPNSQWTLKAFVWEGDSSTFDATKGATAETTFTVLP